MPGVTATLSNVSECRRCSSDEKASWHTFEAPYALPSE
eukprot:CAMPEP_0181169168 /NCGR_PEP_ID=MMETSP1096-20121128/668_1 /TAXON_ID=156174 ORGANISM="Chrysochromulina ericina, Strain CCMP281" /NCGR_SAMPLE_ID=MMETSP1096 /ASSEMBLY_ACC=CAM_ASM_000453 /LENGTH=37 /DNA_ID= /DNA_START= /DNA_END= /DNA_ORIENTATION=